MGRPSKFTPEVRKRILDALRIGATRQDAALASGVSVSLFMEWLDNGRKQKTGAFVEFLESVEQAEGEARLKFTAVIARAANDGDWRAAESYLKRRDRASWGDNQDVTSGGGPLVLRVVYDDESTPHA